MDECNAVWDTCNRTPSPHRGASAAFGFGVSTGLCTSLINSAVGHLCGRMGWSGHFHSP